MSTNATPPGVPYTVCGGFFNGSAGAGAVLSPGSWGIAAASVARTGKGVYTITLVEKPAAGTFHVDVTCWTADRFVDAPTYVANTGVITLNILDDANAAQESDISFEIRGFPQS